MRDLQTVRATGDAQAFAERSRAPHRGKRGLDHKRQRLLVMRLGEADDAAQKSKNIFAVLHQVGSRCGDIFSVNVSKWLIKG